MVVSSYFVTGLSSGILIGRPTTGSCACSLPTLYLNICNGQAKSNAIRTYGPFEFVQYPLHRSCVNRLFPFRLTVLQSRPGQLFWFFCKLTALYHNICNGQAKSNATRCSIPMDLSSLFSVSCIDRV